MWEPDAGKCDYSHCDSNHNGDPWRVSQEKETAMAGRGGGGQERLCQRSNSWVNSCPEDKSGRAFQESNPALTKAQQPTSAYVSGLLLVNGRYWPCGVRGLDTVTRAGSSHLSLASRHWSNPGQAREECIRPAPHFPQYGLAEFWDSPQLTRAEAPPPRHSRPISWL